MVYNYSCSLGRLVCPWPCRGSRHDRHLDSIGSSPARVEAFRPFFLVSRALALEAAASLELLEARWWHGHR